MYENWFADSADVAQYMARRRPQLLEASSRLPVELMRSTLPEKFKLSLLDQLNTLTKSTHFIRDGRIGLQEGLGCCAFNTVDVDHYSSYALATLFPQLRRKILEMQTALAHPLNGKIHHGLPGTVEEIPAGGDAQEGYSRWDVCCQYALQVYRDTKWAGDLETARACWPTLTRAMKLVADLDFYGVGLPYIEGGITYDHWDMRGVVGYMAGVYLAALRATEDLASLLGDGATEQWARGLFERGRAAFERLLWNGKQYLLFYGRRPKRWKPSDETRGEKKHFEAQRPPAEFCDAPAPDDGGCGASCACHREKPYLEIGDEGVMTDLLNGNATAAVMGLGAFLDPARVRRQLRLVLKRNHQPENRAVINGSYPDGHFLDEWPFSQWQTPWTGSEYFLALQLYCAGMVREGDAVVDWVYDRHVREGVRFDHAECNNHYARPLCLWGAYAARLGLEIDAFRARVALRPPADEPYDGALIAATALGRLSYRASKRQTDVAISILDGRLSIRTLAIRTRRPPRAVTVRLNGVALAAKLEDAGRGNGDAEIRLPRTITLRKGQSLSVRVGAA